MDITKKYIEVKQSPLKFNFHLVDPTIRIVNKLDIYTPKWQSFNKSIEANLSHKRTHSIYRTSDECNLVTKF